MTVSVTDMLQVLPECQVSHGHHGPGVTQDCHWSCLKQWARLPMWKEMKGCSGKKKRHLKRLDNMEEQGMRRGWKLLYLSLFVVVGCGGQGGVGDAERGMSLERQNRAAHEGVHVPAKKLGCFYNRQWKINNIRCLYLITLKKSLLWLLSDKVWMQRNNELIILHRRTESW